MDKQTEIGQLVIDEAFDVFTQCGAEDDFCVQHIGFPGAVFGGTNRLLWTPSRGFRPDHTYCTPRFLHEYFDRYGG